MEIAIVLFILVMLYYLKKMVAVIFVFLYTSGACFALWVLYLLVSDIGGGQ